MIFFCHCAAFHSHHGDPGVIPGEYENFHGNYQKLVSYFVLKIHIRKNSTIMKIHCM